MRKNKVKHGIIALLAIIVAICLIAGTYARYSSTGTASASAQIAKWNVAIKNGNTDLTQSTQNITFMVQNNDNVLQGKIAPGVKATADITLDLTGTEVSVEFDAAVNTSEITALNNSNLAIATKYEETVLASGIPQVFALPDGAAFTSQNGQKTITLELTWTDDENNNANDTSLGVAGGTITIPVTLTAKQHLGNTVTLEPTTDVNSVLSKAASIGENGTLVLTDDLDLTTYENSDYNTPQNIVRLPNGATFNLNGEEMKTRNFAVSFQGNNITIQNGTMTGLPRFSTDTADKASYALFVWDNNNTSNNVRIRNITASAGMNFKNAQNVVIEDCDVTAAQYYAVYGNVGSTITIKSGTYKANSKALFGYNSYDKDWPGITNPEDGFKIYGGTFITNGKDFCLTGENSNKTEGWHAPVVYGGTFDCDVSDYVAEGYACHDNGNGTYTVAQ